MFVSDHSFTNRLRRRAHQKTAWQLLHHPHRHLHQCPPRLLPRRQFNRCVRFLTCNYRCVGKHKSIITKGHNSKLRFLFLVLKTNVNYPLPAYLPLSITLTAQFRYWHPQSICVQSQLCLMAIIWFKINSKWCRLASNSSSNFNRSSSRAAKASSMKCNSRSSKI